MRFYLIALLLLLSVSWVDAQHLTRHQADSLINRVPRFTPGITESGDCLRLAQYFIEKEGSKKPDLDNASFFINKAKTLSPVKYSAKIQGYILLEQSFLCDEKGDQRATISFTSRAIPILKNGGDSILLGKAYYELSRCYPDYNNFKQRTKRILLIDSAIRYLDGTPDKEELAADLLMQADLYNIQTDYNASIKILKRSLEIYKSLHHKKIQGAYILLSDNYSHFADYKKALNYAIMALHACKITNDTSAQLIQVQNVIGAIYKNIGYEKLALKFWNDGLQRSIRTRNIPASYILTINLCQVLMPNQSEKALKYLQSVTRQFPYEKDSYFSFFCTILYLKIYSATGQLEQAKRYFINCEKLINENVLSDVREIDNCYEGMAIYLVKTRQFKRAQFYSRLYLDATQSTNYPAQRLSALSLQFQIDSSSKNFGAAIKSHIKYYVYRDSILSEKRKKDLQELEISYQTKDKDNAITVLNQKNKLQEDEISRAVRLRNESIGGSAFVLLIVGLISRQNRIRQKAYGIIRKQNELITTKNEEISTKNELLEGLVLEKEYLVLEIHHRVKNNLQTTMSLLNMQSESISDKKALNAIRDSQRRMYTMSLLHNRLYQSEKKGLISMNVYIGELLVYLFESFVEVENGYTADIDHPIPAECDQ